MRKVVDIWSVAVDAIDGDTGAEKNCVIKVMVAAGADMEAAHDAAYNIVSEDCDKGNDIIFAYRVAEGVVVDETLFASA